MSSFRAPKSATTVDPTRAPEFLDTPEHEDASRLLRYWESKRQGRFMPDRRDIRPAEIASLLPHLGIVEVIGEGEDFRFRLYGTQLVEHTGVDRSGVLMSELRASPTSLLSDEETRRRWLEVARLAYRTEGPLFLKVHLVGTGSYALVSHAVSLPLTAGGSKTTQLMGAAFLEAEPRE